MPTCTLHTRAFPKGDLLILDSIMPLEYPSQLIEHAFANFQVPNQADPSHPLDYGFLFWNVDGDVTKAADITVAVPNHDFPMTRWYVKKEPNGPSPSRVDIYAFSAGQDEFLSDIPIASVTRQAAWKAGTSSVDTTNADVQITALDTLGTEEFDQWIVLWGSETPAGKPLYDVKGKILSAVKKAYVLAMAVFKARASSVSPHPEWELLETLDALRRKLINPGDPLPYDIRRITERIRQEAVAEKSGVQDNVTEIFTRIGQMSPGELRHASAEIKAQIRRLQAAQKAIESASKGAR